jgi:hypothetical protein
MGKKNALRCKISSERTLLFREEREGLVVCDLCAVVDDYVLAVAGESNAD